MSGTTNTIIEFTDASAPLEEGTKCVILFYAEWHEACAPGGPLEAILTALAAASPLQFGRCNVDDNPALVAKYQIEAVPTFFLLQGRETVVTRLVGVEDVAAITAAVQRLAAAPTTAPPVVVDEATRLQQRLEQLIRHAPVMVFMKGTPEQPRCGFSRQVVELLQSERISFGAFDILTDEAVRQGLKTYADWPTYPQVYLRGELIGGLDILKEMKADGGSSLVEQLGLAGETTAVTPIENKSKSSSSSSTYEPALTLEERLKALIHRSPVMLFMKGVPTAPRCGFSRQIVELLERAGVAYDAMDILSDEEVRQGLKEYSDWPTYPQLYVNGELLGGLDIVQEMEQDGSLKDLLQKT
jgi:Grx4 family monothiol glutaredoxin